MNVHFTQFANRYVHPLGTRSLGRWNIKAYALTSDNSALSSSLIEEAIEIATHELPLDQQEGLPHYFTGWLIVHKGTAGEYVLLDWWCGEDIIQHRLYGRAIGDPSPFRLGWPQGACCCIWELAILWHEREAWVKHVLSRASAPDFEGYLADSLSGPV